ncbi:hypothetical protein DPMN_148575 [Dreissena polymorpha]|uniref:Uncharacterized protein n=1 Tax=Dreissena polymorpha TaxID=45954 RepID=A0A9D4FEA5_DREPO|nr:hypothetical protein DPMN_148575 [Dreissena polymorpha]
MVWLHVPMVYVKPRPGQMPKEDRMVKAHGSKPESVSERHVVSTQKRKHRRNYYAYKFGRNRAR